MKGIGKVAERYGKFVTILIATLLGMFAVAVAAAEDIHVNALVEGHEFFLGESFIYQIKVVGSENPQRPDTSGIRDFHVEFLGGRNSSSQSVTIIGGRVSRTVKKEFIFTYRLTPRQTGDLLIPSLKVIVENREHTVPAIPITVMRPTESEDFKLRISLSKDTCYVGEPVILDVTWYFARDIRSFSFNMPIFGNENFKLSDVPDYNNPRLERYEIPTGGTKTIGVKGQGKLGDRMYATINFKKALIPQKPGVYEIDNNTVLCEALAGYRERQQGRDDFFDDFFSDSFFGRRDNAVFKKIVVPSNNLKLKVLELPEQGKPANFAGHVGRYRIQASASPVEVNVGDPITLTITISGPVILEGVKPPLLEAQQNLAADFRIPSETAAGRMENGCKIFTQTIRAANSRVKEIPPIELPYFDTESGEYKTAKTLPIPLNVHPTRVLTAHDAEGAEITQLGNEVEERGVGIAHNYEGPAALENQTLGISSWFESQFLTTLLCGLPTAYFLLAVSVWLARKRAADPFASRSKQAYNDLKKTVQKSENNPGMHAEVFAAFRKYLGLKLKIQPDSITFKDIEGILKERGIDSATIDRMQKIFQQYETAVYSGVSNSDDISRLAKEALATAGKLEKLSFDKFNTRVSRTLSLFILACILTCASATASALPGRGELEELLGEAEALFRQANETAADNPEAAKDLYEKSLMRYERIANTVSNGRLYYNIGNIYFKLGNIGQAILNYKKAEQYMPNDRNLKRNLDFVLSRRADRVEQSEKARILHALFFWHYETSFSARSRLFFVFFALTWLAASLRLFYHAPALNRLILVSAILAGIMLVSLSAESVTLAKTKPGVIINEKVTARKGDGEAYEKSFEQPLHAGTDCTLIEKRGNWTRIRLTDGVECWVPSESVEFVR